MNQGSTKTALVTLGVLLGACSVGGRMTARPAPEFPSAAADRWLGAAPVTMASLRGDVVLVEAWHRT